MVLFMLYKHTSYQGTAATAGVTHADRMEPDDNGNRCRNGNMTRRCFPTGYHSFTSSHNTLEVTSTRSAQVCAISSTAALSSGLCEKSSMSF